MFRYMIKQWKSKKVTVILIILGFFIGSLVLSIGTSITVENYNYIMDKTSGRADSQLEITIEKEEMLEWNVLDEIINKISNYGELQLINSPKVEVGLENRQYQIVPALLNKTSEWHIPIIKGRYLKQSDMKTKNKEVVIGKKIADELSVAIGDTIEVDKEKCTIVGVCGRNVRGTIWDNVIYVTYSDLDIKNKTYFEDAHAIFMLLKNGKQEFINNSTEMIEELHTKGINLYFNEISTETDYSSVMNSVFLTVISAGIIFMIAIINIINLMIYWIMERKKEFAIMKAIGGNDGFIVNYIVKEVLCMAVTGALTAVIVQSLIVFFFSGIMLRNNIYIDITIVNCIVAVCIATICGLIAAIIPAKMTLGIQPSEVLSCE